jgi:hypothetical protein
MSIGQDPINMNTIAIISQDDQNPPLVLLLQMSITLQLPFLLDDNNYSYDTNESQLKWAISQIISANFVKFYFGHPYPKGYSQPYHQT